MSFPPYPKYKASGVEWLGDVPEHWTVPQIKRTTYLKARVGWKGLTSEEFRENAFAYLVTGSDFRGKFVEWDKCYQVERDRYEDDPFIQLENGDLLITKDGTIGKLAIVSGLDRPACLNSGIFVARPRNTYSSAFMYWILSSRVFSVFCELESFGCTINHLYQNVFERFAFPAPPESEQTAIAEFLDRETGKIDGLVAEQRRLMELLKEKRQAVISHAVTKGLNPHAPMKPSGIEWLGDVPVGWKVGPVKRFFKSCNTRRIPLSGEERGGRSGVYPYYGASGIIDHIDEFIFDEDLVLVSEDGANLLNRASPIAFVATGKYWVNNHAHILRPMDSNLTFWAARIESIDITPFVTGSAQPKFTSEALGALIISVPSSENERVHIQQHITAESSKFDTLTAEAQRAIDLLQERRTALISAAVTGQIDVRPHPKN